MHHLPDDRPGPDDRHLDDDVVEAAADAAAAASPSARATRPGRCRSCPLPAASCRRPDRRGAGGRDRRLGARGSRARGLGVGLGLAGRLDVRSTPSRPDLRTVPSPESRAPMPFTSVQRILQHRHHPEPEQIDLDEPHVGAVVLVPLDDDAVGHAGVLERHDSSRRPWQMTMPPECWPRWRGRSWMRCQSRPNSCIVWIAGRRCRPRAGCARASPSDRPTRSGS